jgi:hypothetical protein
MVHSLTRCRAEGSGKVPMELQLEDAQIWLIRPEIFYFVMLASDKSIVLYVPNRTTSCGCGHSRSIPIIASSVAELSGLTMNFEPGGLVEKGRFRSLWSAASLVAFA